MTTMRRCSAGLAVRIDHDHHGVDRHVGDLSFCNHTPRPEGLPTEMLLGITPGGNVLLLDGSADAVGEWLSGSGRRAFRATLTYQTELTRIPPVPATTEEQPVSWS